MVPSTLVGLAIIVLAVLPGFVYQISLRGWRGPHTDESDVQIRVLRGIAGSVVLVVLYVLVLGDMLVDAVTDDTFIRTRPREAALWILVMVGVAPWAAATARYLVTTSKRWTKLASWMQGRLGRSHTREASAWDYAFEQNRATGWVRVLCSDGQYIGGWRGKRSVSSSYPQPRDLYLEESYRMNVDGSFTDDVAAPDGIWVRCDDIRAVEFVPDTDQIKPSRKWWRRQR